MLLEEELEERVEEREREEWKQIIIANLYLLFYQKEGRKEFK